MRIVNVLFGVKEFGTAKVLFIANNRGLWVLQDF